MPRRDPLSFDESSESDASSASSTSRRRRGKNRRSRSVSRSSRSSGGGSGRSNSSDRDSRAYAGSEADSESQSLPRTQKSRKRSRKKHLSRRKRAKRRRHATRRRRSRSSSGHASDSSGSDAAVSGDGPGSSSALLGRDGYDVVARDDLVRVPELDVKMFDDWDALESYLKSYSRRTYQIFSIRTNTPVRTRNKRIAASNNPGKLLPESVRFYNKTYVCTHYGKPRGTRSEGTRPHQQSRKIGCPAQINACVRETGNWEVCVTVQKTGHNHEVGPDVYQTYHEARQVSDDEVLSTVQTLHRAGASRKRILEFIMDHTIVEPTMKDVHNLVAQLQKESYSFPTMEERIRAILEDFSANPGNVTRVYSNEEKIVECISIQSSHMRTMFEHFPELLPLLPQPASPKRFRFTQCQWGTQLDNYNCGIFILMFLELCIHGLHQAPSNLEGNIKPAMQFYRYRYLSHVLTTM